MNKDISYYGRVLTYNPQEIIYTIFYTYEKDCLDSSDGRDADTYDIPLDMLDDICAGSLSPGGGGGGGGGHLGI